MSDTAQPSDSKQSNSTQSSSTPVAALAPAMPPASSNANAHPQSGFKRWLLEGIHPEGAEGPGQKPHQHPPHTWWQVMCLTGVDYFSTLGYQPGIAALAAGALSPLATLILVLLTLFGALPIYNRVARESPNGEGSISMLERLLPWWQGKLFVLCLLGFVATDFIITITLSAADAAAHLIENPYTAHIMHGKAILITLTLVFLLGAIFLKGFKEAIGIAVVLVGVYLGLNAIVMAVGIKHVFAHPEVFGQWKTALFQQHGNVFAMIGVSLLLFPKLALGLSGFETGVAVMPLIKGDADDAQGVPNGRIRNTRLLLLVAAVIMSVFLLTSSLVTTLLIPAEAFKEGGKANGRALAYLAHDMLGNGFGTVYDASTILILWFAGASAMAGLINIVPRYLPRYGMAPEWTRASRPLVIVYVVVATVITLLFKADVNAQGGAYATGVLVLMTSAAVAVTISAWKRGAKTAAGGYGVIAVVFAYTTIVNIFERPDGIKIAAVFIFSIVLVSLLSRVWRTTELRVTHIELDDNARRFIEEAAQRSTLHLIANHPDAGDTSEYQDKEKSAREDHQIPAQEPVLFMEVKVRDASDFTDALRVQGVEVDGHRVLRGEGTAVPNSIAALLLHIRDMTGKRPHAYFNWTEGNPLLYLLRYVLSGKGDVAPVTREVLRIAEPNPERRPAIHAAM